MFDVKSLLLRGVEKELVDVADYVFMPERVELMVEGGLLNCVLNSDGRVDLFYTKNGITDVRSATRKHPFTAFETELNHGVYDDSIKELIKDVDKVIESKSEYFRNKVLSLSSTVEPEVLTTTDNH